MTGREGQELWQVILGHVKNQVNPQSFSTWFEPSRLATVREGELVVEGPNQFFVDWLAEHHLETLEEAAALVLGKRPRISFVVSTVNDGVQRIVRTSDRTQRPVRSAVRPIEADGLNPRYTFQEFVVGPNSRLTHAACLAGGGKARARLQPAVHLWRGRTRQDASDARHRTFRARRARAQRFITRRPRRS
jgi:chromosomal replication initiator protein